MTKLVHKTNYSSGGANEFSDAIKTVKIARVKNPLISHFASNTVSAQSRPFLDHEYDLYETGRIIDTEALVARTFQKKRTLMFKNGYKVKSSDDKNLEYINKRIEEISHMSGMSFRKFIREIGYNLISYHNMYVAKVRNLDASSGKVRSYKGGSDINPVAGWFNLATETIQTRINNAGVQLSENQVNRRSRKL